MAENGNDMKPPKLNPICPASNPANKHSYSLKALVTVHFTEEKDERSGETARVCPSCKKGLNNGLKAMRECSLPSLYPFMLEFHSVRVVWRLYHNHTHI